MSADALTVVTLVFPDPRAFTSSATTFSELNGSVSFRYEEPGDVVTLSTTNANSNSDLTGLLYLPELDEGSSCENTIDQYVPENATSQVHLPVGSQFGFLAVAPWISVTCTQEFLSAARDDPLRAFIFFLPNNDTLVPPANDPQWSLGDGDKWKKNTKFPVYAIAGSSGGTILRQMARYSGNLTNVPNGQMLADEFPPNAYVRLAGSIALDNSSRLPSLWVFLVIVLGILLFIIGFTSCFMHWLQGRRRERLRQRVMSGDVDLERLGIKRLTVPRAVLDKMPAYVYPVPDAVEETEQEKDRIPAADDKESTVTATSASHPRTSSEQRHLKSIFAQLTCAICIDDFAPGQSFVRELPCGHIFHTDCVDTFLTQNSSLCPLCKKTSLPRNYCPPSITNAMVRRERRMRQMRERLPASPGESHHAWNPANWQVGRIFSRPLADEPTRPPPARIAARSRPQSSPTNSRRREWARQRSVDMIGGVEDEGSRWVKMRRKIWPGW